MKFRNHPIIMLKPLLAVIGFIIWFIILALEDIVKGKISLNKIWTSMSRLLTRDKLAYFQKDRTFSIIFIAVLAMVILSLIRAFLKWKNSYINIGENSLFYRRQGLFIKVHKEVNFANIANINISSGILYNILGMSILTIDIDSSATANEFDYKMYLSKKNAVLVRDWVLDPNKRFVELEAEGNKCETKIDNFQKESSENSISIKESIENSIGIKESIENSTDIEESLENSSDIGDKKISPTSYRFTAKDSIGHFFLDISTFNIALILGAIGALVNGHFTLFTLVNLGLIKSFFNRIDGLYHLTVKRYPDHLHIEYGLFNLKDFTIPIENISSVGCHKSIFARIFCYKCLTLDAIGYGNEDNENRLLSLYMKDHAIRSFMDQVIPEFSLDEEASEDDFISRPRHLVKYYAPLYTGIFMTIFILIAIPLGRYWIGLLGLPLAILASLYKIVGRKIRLTDKELTIKKGLFSSQTLVIPLAHIDMISIDKNPIYKKLGVESLTIYKRDPKTGKTTEDTGPYPLGIFDQLVGYYSRGEIKN